MRQSKYVAHLFEIVSILITVPESYDHLFFSFSSQPSSVIGITLPVCATSCAETPAWSRGIQSSGGWDVTTCGRYASASNLSVTPKLISRSGRYERSVK
ncbi:hypothetical protein FJTKL_12469 [Diaporthe vaccinii]|uniref:Uncharacterized protein n=1 Tax=Diaporthe vaccinii TaxID=105482 RepID=A0ABR4EDF2_9PEZI